MPRDTRSIGEIQAEQMMGNEIRKRLEEIIHSHKLGECDFLGFLGDDAVEDSLLAALKSLKVNKPSKQTERARRYEVLISEMEKVYSYFKIYVVDNLDK